MWHVSFNQAEVDLSEEPEPMNEYKLREYFLGLTPEELDGITTGIPRSTRVSANREVPTSQVVSSFAL